MTAGKILSTSLVKDILISIILIFWVILFTALFEKPLSYNGGLGWDGLAYYRIAQQIRDGQQPTYNPPYVYRLGTPFLVAILFSNNLLLGFKAVNIAGSLLSILLLLILLRRYLKNRVIRMILVGLFITQSMGPLRTSLFSPTQVEPGSIAFNLLGFIFVCILQKEKPRRYIFIFGLVSFLGTLIRESTILIPFVYMISKTLDIFQSQPEYNLEKIKFWISSTIPFIGGLIGIICTHTFAVPTNDYSILTAAIYWIYEKPILAYVYGYFITYGPMISILYPARNVVMDFLAGHRFELYYLVVISGLAWIIGSDTDRFLYWAIPIWYIMFGLALEYLWPVLKKSWGLFLVLLFLQGLAQRSFLPTPDYAPENIQYRIPLMTVICNDGCLLDIPSYHGLAGSGLNAASCSVIPCYWNGKIFYLKLFLLLENILVTCLLLLGLLRAERRLNYSVAAPA